MSKTLNPFGTSVRLNGDDIHVTARHLRGKIAMTSTDAFLDGALGDALRAAGARPAHQISVRRDDGSSLTDRAADSLYALSRAFAERIQPSSGTPSLSIIEPPPQERMARVILHRDPRSQVLQWLLPSAEPRLFRPERDAGQDSGMATTKVMAFRHVGRQRPSNAATRTPRSPFES
jgi:hypothetical protein